MRRILFTLVLLSALPTGMAYAQGAHAAHATASDSSAVLAVVDAFHRALSSGDSTSAMALLAQDALIAESGGLETRDEYRSHHLPGDMAYAAAVARTSNVISVRIVGDAAWVVATSVTTGTFRERKVDARGAELVVLRRQEGAWRIAAIHWSSRRGS